MDKFEQLNSFLEGELDSGKEQVLFEELASNDVLRGEFKNLLAISETVKSNRMIFAKNEKTKKAVFATLGLSIPVADAATGGIASGALGYGIKSLVATGILSAIATAILFFTFGNTENETLATNKSYSHPNLVVELPQEVPIVTSTDISDQESFYKAEYEKLIAQNSYYKNTINNLNNQLADKNKLIASYGANLNSIEDLKSDFTKLEELYAQSNSDLDNAMLQSNNEIAELNRLISQKNSQINDLMTQNAEKSYIDIQPIVTNKAESSNWSAEWKGMQTYHTNNAEISNSDLSQFNNNSLSVMYNFTNGFSVGADLRQETFLLEFTGKNENGFTYLYRQEPNFTTLSMLSRYTLDLSQTLDPFAQVTFGGNKIGVVGRLMGGVVYSPYAHLNMIVGVEYNNMFFQYQGDRFNSGKIGINYGLSVQF